MLTPMFLGDTAGNTDQLLDFSTAVTGSLFFVPSLDFLEDLPSPPSGRAAASPGVLTVTPLPATERPPTAHLVSAH